MSRRRRLWLLPASLLLALLLGVLPLPLAAQPLRPFWLALVLAYWVLEEPEHAGLGLAFAAGVIADLAFGTVLGEHALRLVIFTFILQRFRHQLRFYPLWQQALALCALLLNDRVIVTALRVVLGQPQWPVQHWLAPLWALLLWMPLFILLDAVRLERRG